MGHGDRRNNLVRGAALLAGALLTLSVVTTSALAQESDGVAVSATIDGEPIEGADNADPLELGGDPAAEVELTVDNSSDSDLAVHRVRLEGTAFGVSFVAYDTLLPFTVEAGESEVVTYELPLNDLDDQAMGLLPASLGLYDEQGERLASSSFTLDVQGRAGSLTGVFAGLVALLTAAAVGVNLYLVASRRLPANRILRGLRFLVPGLGLGVLLTLLLAMTRLLAPYNSVWPFMVVIPGVLAFLLGYTSPGPLDPDDDLDELDLLERPELATR